MKLPKSAVVFVLVALFVAGAAARFSTTSRMDSPYFKGASAMTYRHAVEVADGKSLRVPDGKANAPGKYTPARYRAAGVEEGLGWTLRICSYFSDADGRDIARRLFVILSALCVFSIYGVARRLWRSEAAGLLAAGLVAFLPPLVDATNGRDLGHDVAAAFVLSLYALAVLRLRAAATQRALVWWTTSVTVTAFVAIAMWESAVWVLAIWVLRFVVVHRTGRRVTAAFLIANGVALALALATCPYLTSGESFPTLAYLATRIRFLFGRPESPALLSDQMRHLWSLDHAPLPPGTMIRLFLPLLPLAAAAAINRACRERGRVAVTAALVLVASAVMAALDRGILPVAALAMVTVVAGAATSITRGLRLRAPLIAAGAFIAFAGVVFTDSGPDLSYDVARAAGVAHRDPYSFLWVSLENTDRKLVGFIAQRTSVRDAILAPEDLSALLLTFTGRTSVLLPAASSTAAAEKDVRFTRLLYGDQAVFYQACRDSGIAYVVYSIDVMLDAGEYSPRYLAGVSTLDPGSVAYRMHFAPETLDHFTLVYENDHYRLFKLTEMPEPIFLTDHPPFYDPQLLARSGGNLETFRRNVVTLIVACGDGMRAREVGNLEFARARLAWCVRQAPRFTRARIALADVLMDMDRYPEALRVVMKVVEYAPDNAQAMYYAAFANAHMGHFDAARGLLKVVRASTHDRELLQKATLLETYMKQGLPPPGVSTPVAPDTTGAP